ncbi:MAG: 3-deoxy-D-manno-octulosonic acid transferase, partial [Chitinophagales bacterium]
MKILFAFLYDVGIFFYRAGIQIASLRNSKAKQWIAGRKNLFQKIPSQLNLNEYRVWFHCASVGEFEQGRPVIEAYRKKFPSHKIVLTFFSPSGFELRKNYSGADYIFYLPLDTKRNASRFISLVDPKLTVFVKYEFWFRFLSEINRREIPAIMISAIFRENHLLFNSFFKPLKNVVMSIRKIFVQDENSVRFLQQNNFMNAELAGDTRFDRVWQIAQSPGKLPIIEQFKADKKLFVAGSTWLADEKLLFQLIAATDDSWRWIIVPHEIETSHISELKKNYSEVILYSELENGRPAGHKKILVVDKIGFLSSIYQHAHLAYIGGGFGKGIHSLLEA